MTPATFPVACILAFVVVCVIWGAWRLLVWLVFVITRLFGDAAKWRRFARTCGSRASAQRILKAAELLEVSSEHFLPAASVVALASEASAESVERPAGLAERRRTLEPFAHLKFARRQAD